MTGQREAGWWRRRGHVPLIMQAEASECGLACIAMVAAYYGQHHDLGELRRRFSVSARGARLASLIEVARELRLASRPLRLELGDLRQLRLPCILHWNFNHFVVLQRVGNRTASILDPASGLKVLAAADVSRAFTGVALELWPDRGFERGRASRAPRLRDVLGPIHGFRRSLAQVLLLALALEIFGLVQPLFQRWLVDEVLPTGDSNLLDTLAIGFGLMILLQQATALTRAWAVMRIGSALSLQWQSGLFGHLVRLPIRYFEQRHLGDIVSRFSSIGTIQRTVTGAFLESVLDGLFSIATFGLMCWASARLAAVSLVASLIYAALRALTLRPMRRLTEEQISHAARQQGQFIETLRGIRALKLAQREEQRRVAWLAPLVDQINAEIRLQQFALGYRIASDALVGLETILLLWLGGGAVLARDLTLGTLFAFLAYRSQFAARTAGLVNKLVEVRMLRLSAQRLADIVDHEVDATSSTTNVATDRQLPATIELKGVGFRYSAGEPLILAELDLVVGVGQCVAIRGVSGSGKSTLLSLILGIHAPSSGEVRVAGMAPGGASGGRARSLVAAVLQDDTLFAGSLTDNISFFDPHVDHRWLETCAAVAAIHDEIVLMPMGYNTLVGDMGTALSGGQRQRILLARALYRRPRILLLDEATSHLDPACERQVSDAIARIGITRLMIAHRAETLARAERVLRLETGRLIEEERLSAPIT